MSLSCLSYFTNTTPFPSQEPRLHPYFDLLMTPFYLFSGTTLAFVLALIESGSFDDSFFPALLVRAG